MPCQTEEPDHNHVATQRAAKLYIYVLAHLNPFGANRPQWVVDLTKNPYAQDDRVIPLLCELALAVLSARPDFEAIKDKRMGELTPTQQDDARELWLRKQISDTGRPPHDLALHIVFLLKRLDAARGVVA